MNSQWYGLIAYATALQKQHQVNPPYIMGLEHPTVITLGKRGLIANDVFTDTIPVIKTDRGGEATLHSPGQLIIYPIIDLKSYNITARKYVELLLAVTQQILCESGVQCEYDLSKPGVYTQRGKIAFLGIHINRGISSHGLAINVHNDLTLFNAIRSCGINNAKLDKIANTQPALSCEQVFHRWANCFKNHIAQKDLQDLRGDGVSRSRQALHNQSSSHWLK